MNQDNKEEYSLESPYLDKIMTKSKSQITFTEEFDANIDKVEVESKSISMKNDPNTNLINISDEKRSSSISPFKEITETKEEELIKTHKMNEISFRSDQSTPVVRAPPVPYIEKDQSELIEDQTSMVAYLLNISHRDSLRRSEEERLKSRLLNNPSPSKLPYETVMETKSSSVATLIRNQNRKNEPSKIAKSVKSSPQRIPTDSKVILSKEKSQLSDTRISVSRLNLLYQKIHTGASGRPSTTTKSSVSKRTKSSDDVNNTSMNVKSPQVTPVTPKRKKIGESNEGLLPKSSPEEPVISNVYLVFYNLFIHLLICF